MTPDMDKHYLKEIDHVSIIESIDEVFDHATDLMTPNAVMYGSTITAMIAGLSIVGDLDIAVSNQEYMKLCQNFSSSVKWVQIDGKHIPERKAPTSGGRAFTFNPSNSYGQKVSQKKRGSNPYEDAKMPITKVVVFKTVNEARVQIMESKVMSGDRLEDALAVVRKVDFTFCGMALDMYGRMLETIPHAYDDCLQRVIRIQDYQPRTDPNALKARIQKYLRRGWQLTMSIDQAMTNLDKAKREYLKKEAKKPKKKFKTKNISGFYKKRQSNGHTTICAKKSLVDMIGMSIVADTVRSIARNDFSINLRPANNSVGTLDFWSAIEGTDLEPKMADLIIDTSDRYFKAKYDYNDLPAYEKKMTSTGRYKTGGYVSGGFITTKDGMHISGGSSTDSTSTWK